MIGNLNSVLRERPWIISIGFAGLVLALWQFATIQSWFPDYILGPINIVAEFVAMFHRGELGDQVGASLRRALAGFAIGSGIGVVLGLLAGVSRVFRDLFDLTQAFIHPIPKIALFPAIAVLLGFTDQTRIFIIALSAFFPAYLNALNGALGVDPRMIWVGQNAGAVRVRIFFQILLPASLPRTVVGLRISLMVSFIMMVATEVVGHSNGLGAGLMRAYEEGVYGEMYGGILAVAICGVLSNAALAMISRRLLAWQAIGGVQRG